MKSFIFIKKNAVSQQKCKNIIDILNTVKLNPGNSERIKNFYSGMPVDVYQSEWKDDLFNCIIEYKKQHKFLDSENLCQRQLQETCFPQQDTSVYPEQGTLAIWPAAWTHSHYGKPAPEEYKYIVTGWANYVQL